MALKTDLQLYWKMEEASGAILDAHGSFDSTGGTAAGTAAGKIDNGRDFESGSSQYFTVPQASGELCPSSGDFTWTGWVKYESLDAFMVLLSIGANGYELRLNGDGNRLQGGISFPGNLATDTGTAISTGTWYFVALWWDDAAETIYLSVNDGTPVSASETGAVLNATGDLGVGGRPNGSLFTDGVMDEWAFHLRKLSAAEITEIYNSGNGLGYDDWDAALDSDLTITFGFSTSLTTVSDFAAVCSFGTDFSGQVKPTSDLAIEFGFTTSFRTLSGNNGGGAISMMGGKRLDLIFSLHH